MLNRMTMMTVWTAAVLALGAVVVAAGIYLLARLLFRRRSIALIASVLVLADGMRDEAGRVVVGEGRASDEAPV